MYLGELDTREASRVLRRQLVRNGQVLLEVGVPLVDHRTDRAQPTCRSVSRTNFLISWQGGSEEMWGGGEDMDRDRDKDSDMDRDRDKDSGRDMDTEVTNIH